jgi:1-aminocyclopropane-1-carboxylate deaminase
MFLPLDNITLDKLEIPFLKAKGIKISILRLDKIHPTVSGNKLFKLHYFVTKCLLTSHKTILTFGGAYSNHLVATAFLCKENNIKCIGIIRGEKPNTLSHTLLYCIELGMQLFFISRDEYKNMNEVEQRNTLKNRFGDCTIVPEGGYDVEGAKGAAMIMDLLKNENPTHICTCVGTATTLAGLLQNNITNAEIIAVPAIKNMIDIEERIFAITKKKYNFTILGDYHFGGYAKHNKTLIDFMNSFYAENQIPTDFVYTAKMMFGILEKVKDGYFKKGANIVCLHTGGLQGNLSLPTGTLNF